MVDGEPHLDNSTNELRLQNRGIDTLAVNIQETEIVEGMGVLDLPDASSKLVGANVVLQGVCRIRLYVGSGLEKDRSRHWHA